jgi:hypothetical protein
MNQEEIIARLEQFIKKVELAPGIEPKEEVSHNSLDEAKEMLERIKVGDQTFDQGISEFLSQGQ